MAGICLAVMLMAVRLYVSGERMRNFTTTKMRVIYWRIDAELVGVWLVMGRPNGLDLGLHVGGLARNCSFCFNS
jgi:hypothetical protein